MEALADATLERWFTEPFRADPANAATLARVRAMVAGTPPEGYAGCCAAIRDMDQRDAIGAIDAETLVLTGREDPATPPEAAEAIAGRIASADLHVIDGCAHISNIERPDAFHAAVVPFLRTGM
jgi:3-oxoadipate enol-lactonase